MTAEQRREIKEIMESVNFDEFLFRELEKEHSDMFDD